MKRRLHGTHVFHQLAASALLELCTNSIDEQRIVKLEGHLLLTVESGDVFELVIGDSQTSSDDQLPPTDSVAQGSPTSTCLRENENGPAADMGFDGRRKHRLHGTHAFHQLAANSLLELCTNSIDDERIVKLEGHLLLTVDSEDVFELVIGEGQHAEMSEDGNLSSVILSSLISADHVKLDRDTAGANVESSGSIVLMDDGAFRCSVCGMTQRSRRSICRHLETEHGTAGRDKLAESDGHNAASNATDDETELGGSFKPRKRGRKPLCSASGGDGDAGQSTKKKRTHWGTVFLCRLCNDMKFESRSLQVLHRIQEHREHHCDECELYFIGRRSFVEHVRAVHPGVALYKVNKRYVCEYCSEVCLDETRLSDHIASRHLGVIHVCNICNKQLGSAETLRIHKRELHDPLRRRTCEICGRQFSRLAGLLEHMHTSHPEHVPEHYQLKLGELKCEPCGMTFKRRDTLRRHNETKHSSTTDHICQVCGYKFRCRRYLRRHQRTHHSGGVASSKVNAVKLEVSEIKMKDEKDLELLVKNSASSEATAPELEAGEVEFADDADLELLVENSSV